MHVVGGQSGTQQCLTVSTTFLVLSGDVPPTLSAASNALKKTNKAIYADPQGWDPLARAAGIGFELCAKAVPVPAGTTAGARKEALQNCKQSWIPSGDDPQTIPAGYATSFQKIKMAPERRNCLAQGFRAAYLRGETPDLFAISNRCTGDVCQRDVDTCVANCQSNFTDCKSALKGAGMRYWRRGGISHGTCSSSDSSMDSIHIALILIIVCLVGLVVYLATVKD